MNTTKFKKGNVRVIAHRGLSGIERENTNAAFVAAGNRSYYGIETDIHRTADGRFVVCHDNDLFRVSGERCRASFGYSECAKIAKNLSPFMAADFSLFCHGFRPRGPSRPPHPLALGCRTAEFLLEREAEQKVAGLMWGLLAPTPPRQGAQALHRSMELVCRASFGYSECAKIAKNLSPFMAADFSLFCHGFRQRGPSRPPPPLR